MIACKFKLRTSRLRPIGGVGVIMTKADQNMKVAVLTWRVAPRQCGRIIFLAVEGEDRVSGD